jgi:hypothetical protein
MEKKKTMGTRSCNQLQGMMTWIRPITELSRYSYHQQALHITKKLTTKAESNRILNLYSVMGLHASKIKGSVVLCGVV